MSKNNNYCPQKWYWLTIDPERKSLASCCSADFQKIDVSWLKSNPGQLFNTPELKQDRRDMLKNIPVKSCETACWAPERLGIPSHRQVTKTDLVNKPYQTDTAPDPVMLHITMGTDCNLTCSYCTKRFSTAWLRDINNNGGYIDGYDADDRFTVNSKDKLKLKLSIKNVGESEAYNLILDEALKFKNLESAQIVGGEPFLYNDLIKVVSKVSAASIEIFSGLGVNPKRFEQMLDQMPDKVSIAVSAENIGKQHEFNRYGVSYETFLTNLNAISKRGLKYKFASVVSNVTVHGFKEFQDNFSTSDDYLNVCVYPLYLRTNILDQESKDRINAIEFKYRNDEIKAALNAPVDDEHYKMLKQFLPEFARRRNLTLDIFPESFIKWVLE